MCAFKTFSKALEYYTSKITLVVITKKTCIPNDLETIAPLKKVKILN